jgi:PhnB protein
MAGKASPIPEGFHTITPHLICKNAGQAIEFYKKAFGAEEIMRMPGPDGKTVMHAEIKIGDSHLMIADEFPDYGCVGPQTLKGSPVTVHLYVKDADAVYNQAVKAGATASMPLQNMFWGDRYGKLTDPFGHHWSVATHVVDVSPDECAKRAAAAFGGGGCGQQ